MGGIRNESFQPSLNDPLGASFQDFRSPPSGTVVGREPRMLFGFFRPLLVLARQRVSWSPFLILGELWRLVTNIGTQREIFALLKLRPFAEVVHDNPGLAFKYVIPNYLVRSFTVAERASCFLHHYRRMHAALPESLLRTILQGEVTLNEIAKDGNHFSVTIGVPSYPCDKESELSLRLKVDGKKVFALSFIIAPGWVIKSKVTEVLLITCFIGTRGSNPQIKLLLTALHEYSPRKLLVSALQGVGDAFGIDAIAAICAANHRSYSEESAAILKHGYDDFFAALGMTKTVGGFFFSLTPIKSKPFASFNEQQIAMAVERRRTRQQLQTACAALLSGGTDRACHASP